MNEKGIDTSVMVVIAIFMVLVFTQKPRLIQQAGLGAMVVC